MKVGTILLVEDDPNDEALILRALEKANVTNKIDIVRDGVEALDFLFPVDASRNPEARYPTVVLLDLKLPKVDGIEVLRRIRDDARTKHLPVVILTSSDEQEDLVRSYELGANSFVRKPIGFGKFAETVAQLGLYWLLVNEPPPSIR